MTLRQKRDVFADMLESLRQYAKQQGIPLEWGERFRPRWVAVKYALEKIGIVNSKHCSSLAQDLWICTEDGGTILWEDPRYKDLADYWVKLGGKAGHYFQKPAKRDSYHFEYGD